MAQRTAQLELNAVSPHDRIFLIILIFYCLKMFLKTCKLFQIYFTVTGCEWRHLINAKSDDTLQETTFKIPKNGDLLTNIFLEFEIEYNHPDKDGKEFYTVDHFGN